MWWSRKFARSAQDGGRFLSGLTLILSTQGRLLLPNQQLDYNLLIFLGKGIDVTFV